MNIIRKFKILIIMKYQKMIQTQKISYQKIIIKEI